MGFSYTAGPVDVDGVTVMLRYAQVPIWPVLVLPAILPFFWIIAFVIRRYKTTRTESMPAFPVTTEAREE